LDSDNSSLTELIIATIIVAISAVVSVSRQILAGKAASILWIFTEFMSACLAGFFMFEAYPILSEMKYFPDWVTLPIAVAVAAHSGGRVFQEIEDHLENHFKLYKTK